MKKKILFLLILFIPFMVSAEELKMEWQKSFESTDEDKEFEIFNEPNGEYVLVNNTYEYYPDSSIGYKDVIISKYDKNGNILWNKKFGGSETEELNAVYRLENGEIIILGSYNSNDVDGLNNNGGSDIFFVKYDKDGNLLVQNSFGGSGGESLFKTVQLEDGSVILGGIFTSNDIENLSHKGNSDIFLIRYDKDGNLLWQNSFGGKSTENFINMIPLNDNNFCVEIESHSNDLDELSNSLILFKYNKNGELIWKNAIFNNGYGINIKDMICLEDGILLIGNFHSNNISDIPNNGETDIFLIKIDNDGKIVWKKNWGGNKSEYVEYVGYKNNVILILTQSSSTNIDDFDNENAYTYHCLLSYDLNGDLLWKKFIGFLEYNSKINLIQADDGSIVMSGVFSDSGIDGLMGNDRADIFLIKYDKDGTLLWKKSWGGSQREFLDNMVLQDSNIVLIGRTDSIDIQNFPDKSRERMFLLEYDSNGNILYQNSLDDFVQYLGVNNNSYNNLLFIYKIRQSNLIIMSKYVYKYNIDVERNDLNGLIKAEQKDNLGVVIPTANEGFEVDKIIVKDKDGNILDVEVSKLEDGTYSFPLYTDVSVEVLFKEILSNPKTGVSSFIGVMFTLMLIGISGFFMIRNCNNSYEL